MEMHYLILDFNLYVETCTENSTVAQKFHLGNVGGKVNLHVFLVV